MSYNIKQLTNFDVKDNAGEYKDINFGPIVITHYYRIIPYSQLLGIKDGSSESVNININKLGYCINDNKGKYYPIYIDFMDNNNPIEFTIGKTGIFEFQPEEWQDKNDDEIERIASVSVKNLLVPDEVPFTLDYCYLV